MQLIGVREVTPITSVTKNDDGTFTLTDGVESIIVYGTADVYKKDDVDKLVTDGTSVFKETIENLQTTIKELQDKLINDAPPEADSFGEVNNRLNALMEQLTTAKEDLQAQVDGMNHKLDTRYYGVYGGKISESSFKLPEIQVSKNGEIKAIDAVDFEIPEINVSSLKNILV